MQTRSPLSNIHSNARRVFEHSTRSIWTLVSETEQLQQHQAEPTIKLETTENLFFFVKDQISEKCQGEKLWLEFAMLVNCLSFLRSFTEPSKVDITNFCICTTQSQGQHNHHHYSSHCVLSLFFAAVSSARITHIQSRTEVECEERNLLPQDFSCWSDSIIRRRTCPLATCDDHQQDLPTSIRRDGEVECFEKFNASHLLLNTLVY